MPLSGVGYARGKGNTMIIGILFKDHWSGSMFGSRHCYVYDICEVLTEDTVYLTVLLTFSWSTWPQNGLQANKVRILKSAIDQIVWDDLLEPVIRLDLKPNDIEHRPYGDLW